MSIELGEIGIWTSALDTVAVAEAREIAAELEELGYGSLWIPEAVGRNALVHAALLGAATERLVIATGVANIYARDPMSMNAGHQTLADALGERFLLGLGVSHQPAIEGIRHQSWNRPLPYMRDYLDAMDDATFRARPADARRWRMLGALGPKMLELAAARTDGAHTYNVTVDHTASARQILGPDKLLAVELAVVLETDPDLARSTARAHIARYTPLPNYANNLLRLGFEGSDLVGGGTDRLVDALVAWGDTDRVADRVAEHLAAGADHVCLQVLPVAGVLPRREWRELAPLNRFR